MAQISLCGQTYIYHSHQSPSEHRPKRHTLSVNSLHANYDSSPSGRTGTQETPPATYPAEGLQAYCQSNIYTPNWTGCLPVGSTASRVPTTL